MLNTILTVRAVPFSVQFYQFLLIFFIAMAIVSAVFKILSGKSDILLKKRLSRLSVFFLTVSISGFVPLFFNYERAVVLGSRIWFLILGIGFLIWLGFILYDIFVRYPREKKTKKEKDNFEKYLPK